MSYAASKAATDHVVGMLAAKVGRFGIRVNGINPGCKTLPLLLPPPPIYLLLIFVCCCVFCFNVLTLVFDTYLPSRAAKK